MIARLVDLTVSDEVEAADRGRLEELADQWREHLTADRGERYLTVAQLAAQHGVTPQAVYKWIHTGKIEAEETPGGSYRIPTDQFRFSSEKSAHRAATRRKLRELQHGRSMSDNEIVAALRSSRRDNATH